VKKPVIPVLGSADAALNHFARTVKQSLDTQTGQAPQSKPLSELAPTASLAEVIAAYNRLLERVQGK
jgi:hypothetical protein